MTEKFLAIKRIDKENGFTCGLVNVRNERTRPHSHDYFEFLLITSGTACHIINSKKQMLTEGSLLFIRDFDVHAFKKESDNDFEYIYIAMSKELLSSILEYMGDDFPIKHLTNAEDPPMIALNSAEIERIIKIVAQLDQIDNKSSSRLKIKNLLAGLFVDFFADFENSQSDIPLWLETTCEKMRAPANFIEGSKKMLQLSGKSREHLSRMMKKHYNMSPADFVNELRLDYCIHLLTRSELPIVDICYGCGFENLSWFYKVFEKKYGTTPLKYRKKFKEVRYPSKS